MTNEAVSFIEKLAEKDSKRKKKKDAKKSEDGIVRHLAKNGLIDKDNLGESSEKVVVKEEEEEGLSLFIILLL